MASAARALAQFDERPLLGHRGLLRGNARAAHPPTVLIGPNGSGKTTLIKLAMGLLTPTAGRIRYAQADRSARRQAILFQKPAMLRRSAGSNVAYALKA